MKFFFISLFSIFIVFAGWAQGDYDNETPNMEEEEEFVGFNKKKNKQKKDLSRWKLGGDFGFSASDFILTTELSPLVGYQVVEDRIELGAGVIYQYTNIRRSFFSYPSGNAYIPAKINVIGGRNYARVYVWEGLYAQIEGLLINYREKPKSIDRLIKLTIGNALAGAGYKADISEKVHANFSISTNLIINPLYPRRTIIPRIGFQISL